MKQILSILLSVFLLFSLSLECFAKTYVRGYYRKDGTYVSGYYRNTPSSYSTSGKYSGIESIKILSTSTTHLSIGDTLKLETELISEDEEGFIDWESSNEEVAIVDDDGTVTAVGTGYVFIRVICGVFRDSIMLNIGAKISTSNNTETQIGVNLNEISNELLQKIKHSTDEKITEKVAVDSKTTLHSSVFKELAISQSLKINCTTKDSNKRTYSWIFKSNNTSNKSKNVKLFVDFNQSKELSSVYEDIGVMYFEVEHLDEFHQETKLLFRVNDAIVNLALDNTVYLYKYNTDTKMYEYDRTLKIYSTNCVSI